MNKNGGWISTTSPLNSPPLLPQGHCPRRGTAGWCGTPPCRTTSSTPSPGAIPKAKGTPPLPDRQLSRERGVGRGMGGQQLFMFPAGESLGGGDSLGMAPLLPPGAADPYFDPTAYDVFLPRFGCRRRFPPLLPSHRQPSVSLDSSHPISDPTIDTFSLLFDRSLRILPFACVTLSRVLCPTHLTSRESKSILNAFGVWAKKRPASLHL